MNAVVPGRGASSFSSSLFPSSSSSKRVIARIPDALVRFSIRRQGKSFAASVPSGSNNPERGKKITKHERRAFVETFVNKYRASNFGKFPKASLVRRECGGSFYNIRGIVQELEYKHKLSLSDKSKVVELDKEVNEQSVDAEEQPSISDGDKILKFNVKSRDENADVMKLEDTNVKSPSRQIVVETCTTEDSQNSYGLRGDEQTAGDELTGRHLEEHPREIVPHKQDEHSDILKLEVADSLGYLSVQTMLKTTTFKDSQDTLGPKEQEQMGGSIEGHQIQVVSHKEDYHSGPLKLEIYETLSSPSRDTVVEKSTNEDIQDTHGTRGDEQKGTGIEEHLRQVDFYAEDELENSDNLYSTSRQTVAKASSSVDSQDKHIPTGGEQSQSCIEDHPNEHPKRSNDEELTRGPSNFWVSLRSFRDRIFSFWKKM